MPTLPDSGASFTVQTNGQTLIVAAGTSASSLVQTLYSDAACTSAVTTPHTITSNTTYYVPLDVANVAHYISCKQLDGTELWGKKQHVGGITIAPLPSAAQVATDASSLSRLSLAPAGALAETFARGSAAISNVSTLTSARLFMTAIHLPQGLSVSSITFQSGTTAADTPLNQWFALYDSSRALLAQTTDDTTTAWAANSTKTLSFASPFTTTYSGLHYLGIMVKATATVTLFGLSSNAFGNGIAPIISGNSSSTLTDTAPNPASSLSASAPRPYAYVS